MADGITGTRFYPLGAYQGLATGTSWTREVRSSQSDAVDGTKRSLRDARLGSPFMFRVVPPPILLDALLGNGQAHTGDPYDPLLRRVFAEAEITYVETLAAFEAGNASAADVEAARQGLAGGRAPAGNQDLNIIESAMRANANFGTVVDQRNQFKQSNFFATGPTRGATLTRLERLIAANGIEFDPRRTGSTEANQAAVADLTQALDVLLQLNRVLVTPPLTLLVNPNQLQVTYAKKQAFSDRNRYGWIFQSWGEEQVRLSVSGRSAGFVAGSRGGVENGQSATVSGYQYTSKWDSAAWQNHLGLFTFYRNNGYMWNMYESPRSEASSFIGSIEIEYDQWVYSGHFESFQYSYDENKQHGAVEFSFEFVVSFMFDRSQDGPVLAMTPPTPSPSSPLRGGTPFMPNRQAAATRSIQQEIEASSAILNPLIDPFA